MKYRKLFNKKATHQSQPIPGAGQVQNSAGGYAWKVDAWTQLDRFLILGSEDGTYYISERKLTVDNAKHVIACVAIDGQRVVKRIVEVSRKGQAPKNDPAIFALALAASYGDEVTRAAALQALPAVCRTGTHLFQFAEAIEGLRGWGRGLRRAVGRWYNEKSIAELQYQLVKYMQRGGWSHRDMLRLSHPVPVGDEHRALYKWVVSRGSAFQAESASGFQPEKLGQDVPVTLGLQGQATIQTGFPLLDAVERLKSADAKAAVEIIRDNRVPREAVPTELLKEPLIWEALLEDMPMTAMIRNLATMTRIGLIKPGSDAAMTVTSRLADADRLRKARVHPMALLMALRTYASGRGLRGTGEWITVPQIVDALDAAFYTAFENVEPTGKRHLLGVDVSGSMSSCGVAGSPLTACEAATAMAMVTVATEKTVFPMAFAHVFKQLPLSRRMRLDDALRYTKNQNFGATDCALPMKYAMEMELEVDVFVIYTDNETWYGGIHPAQALQQYRQKSGIPAKLIVVGIVSNGFTIADPKDAGMLDVVGFDTTVPQVMAQFAK
ncbi:MAG TPA: TROVE domain-containing protein [Fimbriimonadaceae bacterium]|nr:TROVE domain-containing protein [Fimbriimonadaceae bacterium]